MIGFPLTSDKKINIKATDKHYFLYAKGWYQKSNNIIDDLKKIQSNYTNIDEKHIEVMDILDRLYNIICDIIDQLNMSYRDFFWTLMVKDLFDTNFFPFERSFKVEYDYPTEFIKICLKHLRYIKVINLNVTDVDENILPITHVKKGTKDGG